MLIGESIGSNTISESITDWLLSFSSFTSSGDWVYCEAEEYNSEVFYCDGEVKIKRMSVEANITSILGNTEGKPHSYPGSDEESDDYIIPETPGPKTSSECSEPIYETLYSDPQPASEVLGLSAADTDIDDSYSKSFVVLRQNLLLQNGLLIFK